MENNEELVEQTENTELTAEEIEDVESIEEEPQEETTEPIEEMFTKEQVDNIISKRLARKEAKIRKEYERKYGGLESVVNAGLGTESVEEATNKLKDFYQSKGINIPVTNINDETESNAARWEAEKIIESGYDDIVEEVDDLAKIGIENMTVGEKVKFQMLATERQRLEEEKELKSIGVEKLDDEFKEFSKKLNPELSLREKYELYQQTKPKEIKKMGSMKSGQPSDVKQYYTNEEIDKMSLDDLDKPGVWEAVRESMTRNS